MLTTRTPDAASRDVAAHPIVGVWMATTPSGPAPSIFAADGTVVVGWPGTQAGPRGVAFHSGWVGMWEPTDAFGIHFTAVQVLSDANGAYTGTLTVDGHPRVSDDGQSFVDDSPETTITVRDAQYNVLDVSRGDRPVTGLRMSVRSPGFPEATPAVAAPAT